MLMVTINNSTYSIANLTLKKRRNLYFEKTLKCDNI